MKGIVFNLLEEVVRAEHGEDTWDSLLESAQLDGAYTSLGNYPDEHLIKLVLAASAALRLPPDAIIRWFARNAFPLLAGKYPVFFVAHRSARTFLLTLNDIIHPEVRKLYLGADVPEFAFDTTSDDYLVMEYNSRRKLCAFAEGLIEGAAAHFRQRLEMRQSRCMHRGDDRCTFHVALHPVEA
jgi:hypothetical protein